jgi:ribosomal protein S15P/S13E
MAQQKAKRPRSAKRRTLPPDSASLVVMIRTIHRQLRDRAEHLKNQPHDFFARRGFQILHDQRSAAWTALYALVPQQALALAAEIGTKLPRFVGASAVSSEQGGCDGQVV